MYENENKPHEIVYGKNEDQEQSYRYTWRYKDAAENLVSSDSKSKSAKKKNRIIKAICISLALALVITGSVATGVAFGYILADNESTVQSSFSENSDTPVSSNIKETLSRPDTSDSDDLSITQIAEKCKPSAVGILTTKQTSSIFGYGYTVSGVASGFILTQDGYIATNHHVVSGASGVEVLLENGEKYEAKIIGSDSLTDIAVIKIEAQNLPVAELGNSDELVVGELAVAIGTPADIILAGTVTDGIISAINRDIPLTDSSGNITKTMTLIQTNATISPGNSGGPLINSKGQVIGINTLKLTDKYEGLGFAIPINGAVKIIDQLISDGKVTNREDSFVSGKASIGITQYAEISEREADYYGIPQGILVIQINPSSASYSAGLKRGDIIIKYNGTSIKTAQELENEKARNKPGDEVTITVHRDGTGDVDITFPLDAME